MITWDIWPRCVCCSCCIDSSEARRPRSHQQDGEDWPMEGFVEEEGYVQRALDSEMTGDVLLCGEPLFQNFK